MHAILEEDRMKKLLTALTAGALVTITIPALAEEKMEMDEKEMGAMDMQKMEQMMDANGDGRISKAEFLQGHKKMFNAMDQNKDGQLDTSERQTMMQMMHKGMMEKKHDY
jgi:Ca2+-binding EF-hand superfamily protein